MKTLRVLLVIMFFAKVTSAQTLPEWTKQKKTQINYLIKQVAALQAYATIAKKGYTIVNTGLNIIHDLKKGDFVLHDNYFSSLQNINPTVKAYPKIAAIIAMQVSIVKACHKQRINLSRSNQFTSDELSYADNVFNHLADGCTSIIDQLMVITTNGLLKLKDDERIRQIEYLYHDVELQYEFLQHFGNENKLLAIQRMRDNNDVKVLGELYKIH